MANEVRLDIDVRGEQLAAQKLGKVEKAAESAGDAIADMGDQATVAGKKTDESGEQFKDTADDAGYLTSRITELSAAQKDLIKQLDSTGDTSLKKEIRSIQRELRQLERLAKEIMPSVAEAVAEVATEAGGQAGESMIKEIAERFRDGTAALKGAAVPVLVAVAVAAAPMIGATIGAAVLGGVGAGGLIGGIALAASDSRVKNAAKQFGESAMKDMQFAGAPFVDPVIKGLALGRDAVKKWAADLSPSFASLASMVEPLTQGLIGFGDRMMPGLIKALEGSERVLGVLADELPEVGQAFGDFFADLDPEAAATALKSILDTTEFLIEQTGKWVNLLSGAYMGARDLAQVMNLLPPDMKAKAIGEAGTAVAGFGGAARDAEQDIKDLADTIDHFLGKTFGLEEAQDRAADAFADLTERIKEQREEGVKGAGSLIGNTQAARDNREAMRDLADRYGDLITKYAEAGISTAGLRKQFVDNAVAAGIARKEAEKYATALFGIPSVIATSFTVKGLGNALRDALRLKATLSGAADRGQQWGTGIQERAGGGPVTANRPYLVGENGPELVTFGADGMVHSANDTKAMLNQQAGAAMGGATAIGATQVLIGVRQSESTVMTALATALIPYLQIEVVNQGGDVSTVLGAVGR